MKGEYFIMITAKEAYDIYSKANPNNKVILMLETPTEFIFATERDKKMEALDSINKSTKELGVTWVWNIYKLEDDELKNIDFSSFTDRGPDNNGPSIFQD